MQVRGVQGRVVVCFFGVLRGPIGWQREGRAAAGRVMRARRGRWLRWRDGSRHVPNLGRPDRPTPWRSLMRRTLMRTSAPILRSLSRMVPQVACAKSVSWRPMRRRAHISRSPICSTTLTSRCRRAPGRWRRQNLSHPKHPPGNAAVVPGVVPRRHEFRRKQRDLNRYRNQVFK